MLTYKIFDFTIASDIKFVELPEVESIDDEPKIKILSGASYTDNFYVPEQLDEWLDTHGNISMLSGHINCGYFLSFPEVAEFIISKTFDSIHYFAHKGTPEESIRHLVIDQIVPRVLGQQGQLILHASTTTTPNGNTAIFLGHTGRGKSTLASSFLVNHHHLTSDDSLLVRVEGSKLYSIPNYYGVRLFQDSAESIFENSHNFQPVSHYSSKERLIPAGADVSLESKSEVDAIFLLSEPYLGETSSIYTEKINGAKAIMSIVEQIFLLDRNCKEVIAQQFQNVANLIATNPCIYSLSYPREYALLGEVRKAVIKTMHEAA